MEIKVYATLRDIVGGKSIHLDGFTELTVAEMLQAILVQYPGLRSEFYKSNGDMHSAVHVLINGRDARFLQGDDTVITANDVVRIFPPVGGGQS